MMASSERAQRFWDAGQPDLAARQLEEVLSETPQDIAAQKNLAKAYIAIGRTTEAEQLLASGRDANPRDPQWQYLIASLHFLQGKADDAMTELDAVGEPERSSEAHICTRCAFLMEHGHADAARSFLDQHLANGGAWNGAAASLLLRLVLLAEQYPKQYDDAHAIARQMLAARTRDFSAVLVFAREELLRGEAERVGEFLLANCPDAVGVPQVAALMSAVCGRTGDTKNEQVWLRRALSGVPEVFATAKDVHEYVAFWKGASHGR